MVPYSFCLLAVGLLFSSCSKTEPPSDAVSPSPTPLASNTVLRAHWIGKKKLGITASAYSVMRIWNLAESRYVEGHLVERLAMAPWQSWTNRKESFTAPIPALEEILKEVVNEECWVEIRGAGAGAGQQMAAGIRLDNARAKLFDVSLADVLSSLTGTYPTRRADGWTLRDPRSGTAYDLVRTDNWLLFGAATSTNDLFQEVRARLASSRTPFNARSDDNWLELDADARWLAGQAGLAPAADADLPHISLTAHGNSAQVITSGELVYAKPLGRPLEAWNFPKDLVQEDIVGFSAVRGFGPWLQSTKAWTELNAGEAPNQAFAWSEARSPLLGTHFAIPASHANQLVKSLTGTLPPKANAWFSKNAMGELGPWPDAGLIWKNLPMISPYLRATNDSLITGGMLPTPPPSTNSLPQIYARPKRDELLAMLNGSTNLVALEWETTGERAESVHILSQVLRVIARRPQMPAGTTSSAWLQSVRPRLGNTTTRVTLAAPNRLAFERTSTIGFNALELHLIADWMESPAFPRGFYSTMSPSVSPAAPMKTATGRP